MTFLTVYLAVLAALVTQFALSWVFMRYWLWKLTRDDTPSEPKPQATYRETPHA